MKPWLVCHRNESGAEIVGLHMICCLRSCVMGYKLRSVYKLGHHELQWRAEVPTQVAELCEAAYN